MGPRGHPRGPGPGGQAHSQRPDRGGDRQRVRVRHPLPGQRPAVLPPAPSRRPERHESFDLLWKGIEITTGAQREHRYDLLVAQAREKGMDLEPLAGYLGCFRFGTPPHGGLGMGLSRVLMVSLGLPSIREASFLFRVSQPPRTVDVVPDAFTGAELDTPVALLRPVRRVDHATVTGGPARGRTRACRSRDSG
ncbi:hypothetical protein KGA66_11025 [Actinocrinis puniceicyclus]|uniref:Aminoacyl-tRNA synthetase class II (D/K/N) domain-containing protein n=1 Tax=Actinocrinis puniceicyclus TaxID=977794 RepID=A0A8J7WNX4_9ACTN|nr:hypothetical protein [Actinocrinis puniceicyclus]